MEDREIILEVKDLQKDYPVMRGLIFQKEIGRVQAVNRVSFNLYRGETLGVIGESGCGKTTLSPRGNGAGGCNQRKRYLYGTPDQKGNGS